jgi:pimeloyl-ACP methyl ester carboxylesterase
MNPRPLIAAALALMTAGTAQALELRDCRISAGAAYPSIKARCGTFERPLDPNQPDGETIGLNVAVVPALTLEPAPDPVVPIAGGPGQATTRFYAASASAFETLRRERDIVLLDQRGTGDSAPLQCEVDDDVVQGQLTTEQTLAATRECLDSLPYDPRFFTTSVAVLDLEALREELGYGQLNVYGISYGTRVAQHFARRFPDSTRSVILDGVVPPQMALGPAVAIEAQKALDAIFSRCAEDRRCNDTFPDLAAGFAELVERLASESVSVTLPHPVSGELETLRFGANEFSGAVRLLSYHPTTIALIPLLFDQAAQGNLAPLAAQYLTIRDGFADSLSGGMHNAVVCTEDAPYFGSEAISDQELAATYIGPMMREALVTMCSIWPKGLIDEGFKEPLSTDIPVLLLSGEVDPITPPRYAELAAVDLSNALLLTGRQQGHGMAPRGCTGDVMAEFVGEASVTGIDTSCFERQFAMPFFLDFSGPAP